MVPPQFTADAASWDTNISPALYRAPPVAAYCWFGRPLGKEFTGLASSCLAPPGRSLKGAIGALLGSVIAFQVSTLEILYHFYPLPSMGNSYFFLPVVRCRRSGLPMESFTVTVIVRS